MEVKIGVQHSPRELVVESTQTQVEVRRLVDEAIENSGVLSLTDDKGRTVLVPAERISYVEIAESDARRVGFMVS